MNIYTKAKVVMDGVFQRRETGFSWHCGPIRSVSLKSRLVVRIAVRLQRQCCRKLLASSGGGKAEGGHNQMGSASGLCKFN